MSDNFIGIVNALRRVRSAAIRYGWTIVSESRASTDSRYLEVARGAESIRLRVSDHPCSGDSDVSIDPSEPSVDAALARLASPPVFHGADEARKWHAAMKARRLWALCEGKARETEYARRCGRPDEEAEAVLLRLKAEAEACAPLEDYQVSGGRKRALPVDEEWLEGISGTLDDGPGG
ncbi:MAG: hypothetical protein ACYTFI_06265 [Planctomycetota bacterium]|jgi:hypothetical protein